MESQIVTLKSKDITKDSSEIKVIVQEEDGPDKCDQCYFQSFSGPGALGFHKKWINHKVKVIFKCKECEFDSISVYILKKHIVSIHKVQDPRSDNFSCFREPICETCLPFQNLNQAQYEWPRFSSPDKLKCLECIRSNVDRWNEDCKKALPEDVLHIWSLDPATF